MSTQLALFGMTNHEARVYGALVRVQRARASEIATMTGLPRQHVYTVLHRLMRRGMVSGNKGKVSEFAAVAPETALRSLILEDQVKLRAKLDTLKELSRAHKERDGNDGPLDFIQVMRGPSRQRVSQQLALLRRARREVRLMFRYNAADVAQTEISAADRVELGLLRRGVSVRCLYEQAALENEIELRRTRMLMKGGEQGRVAKLLPMNMMMVDDACAVFNLASPCHGQIIYVVNDASLVSMLQMAFESLWSQSKDVREFLRR